MSPALLEGLRAHFGIEGFRPGQREVIESVIAGRPTLAVMPTGSGKSLCFQLPALLFKGVTLVVSPLIALMKDQVDALSARGIRATFINSALSERERLERASAMERGEYRLVYVAPERFKSPRFMEVLGRTPLELLAVDEAHCISQWGHDFRPDYARLGEVRRRLGAPRTLALTATATPPVRQDICRALGLESPEIFIAGFDRPNLFYEVQRVSSAREKADRAAGLSREGSGVVYAATRRSAERMAAALASRGVPVLCYHAGLPDAERRAAQDAFKRNPRAVVVATSAFGMGVDKPDIRFVAHAEVPRSVEAYYQETGRAGRDGQPARAVLLFNHSDVFLQQRLIAWTYPSEMLIKDLWRLVARMPSAEWELPRLASALGVRDPLAASALRLLEQAGCLERQSGEGRARVQIVVPRAALPERASAQRAALEALREAGVDGEMKEVDLGLLADRSGIQPDSFKRALSSLEAAGIVAWQAAGGFRVVRRMISAEPPLDMRQVRWREERELALLKQITAYAYTRGCRRRYLLRYFGERAESRCDGCDVCKGPRSVALAPAPSRTGSTKVDTRQVTLRLFREGRSVDEIASERGLGTETIREHLAALVEQGVRLDPFRVVPEERARLILLAARAAPALLRAIKRALPPDYLYGEVLFVLAARKAGLLRSLIDRLPSGGMEALENAM